MAGPAYVGGLMDHLPGSGSPERWLQQYLTHHHSLIQSLRILLTTCGHVCRNLGSLLGMVAH